MKNLSRILLTLALIAPATLARGQDPQDLLPVLVEAESGTFGAEFATGVDTTVTPSVGYAFPTTNLINAGNPGSDNRVATYSVTFPKEGVWELYARVRVGPGGANDDSFFYGNGFGLKASASDGAWITVNNFSGGGYTIPTDRVDGKGTAGTQVWKWIRLSGIDWGEGPVNFTVPAGSLSQTFQIGGREDGLRFDKFAFGRQGVFFTVNALDTGGPGTTEPPPPPFVPVGPPMALDQPKFLGSVSSPTQNLNFNAYFNQVTPENGGKWGSVEGTRDVMNWTELDAAHNLAKNNLLKAPGDPRDGTPYPLPFRMHNLVWGNQQPAWIESLPTSEQRAEIEEWFGAVAARYPDIDFIDVVNEPIHDPPAGPTNGNYIAALGGTGATGWDWVITAFERARFYFPNAKLGINEFSVTNSTTTMNQYITIINLLKERGLIDYVGVQGHAFSTTVPNSVTQANLDLLAAVGVPIYVTELDIDGPSDAVQLADYQRIVPVFWEHPAVRGVTLWGYRPGHWRTPQGAYIVLENGAERPAMVWLQSYIKTTKLRPWILANPEPRHVTVGDDVSFTCEGNGSAPLGYQWRKDTAPIDSAGNPSAATATLTLAHVTTAAAGLYDCVVSNVAGRATSSAAALTVDKAMGTVSLSNLLQTYDGGPHAASVTTAPPGLAVDVTYDGSPAAPVNAGDYVVDASIDDADYFGFATGTLTVAKATASVAFVDLTLPYDGTPRAVAVTTVPAGLAVVVTYDGAPTPPTAPGSYAVVATVVDANYVGSAAGTLRVGTTALVRHAPTINGRVEGSVETLLPESFTLNGGAVITSDLLVPGSPTVRLNGSPTYGGTLDGDGDAAPSNYTITLNGGARLRHVVRRTNAVALPAVQAPPAPAGTRDVALNSPGQNPGDFATLRNLILNGNVGAVGVPAGTYGTFIVNGSSSLVLGVAGTTVPAVYNLQGLVVNGGGKVTIVGPVSLTVAGTVVANGGIGAAAHPEWLALDVATGGLTVNGGAAFNGAATAPRGTVVVNGTLNGSVAADRLILNGGAVLKAIE